MNDVIGKTANTRNYDDSKESSEHIAIYHKVIKPYSRNPGRVLFGHHSMATVRFHDACLGISVSWAFATHEDPHTQTHRKMFFKMRRLL